MARSKAIAEILPSLLETFYSIQNPVITPIAGGRLSDTFKVVSGEKTFFLKIPHAPSDNFQFSASVINDPQNKDLSFPEIQPAKDNTLCPLIPEMLGSTKVPESLQGCPFLLTAFHEQAVPDANIKDSKYLQCYAMGKHAGRFATAHHHGENIPADPLSPAAIKTIIQETFNLSDRTYTPEALKTHLQYISLNLNSIVDDPVAKAFANSLQTEGFSDLPERLQTLMDREGAISKPLPKGFIHNDIKPNNFFFTSDQQGIDLAFDLDMIAHGPLVKDLGRAIALTCFDSETGQFQPRYAQALIHGRHASFPLTPEEIKALPHYIELGIIASYALRSSYFRESLHSTELLHTIPRLNPAIQLAELRSFDAWIKHNHIADLLKLPYDKPYPTTPKTPDHTLLGPGPLPSWKMSVKEEEEYWNTNQQPGHHGFSSFESTDGVLHRDDGIRGQCSTGVVGLINETVDLLRTVADIPETSKVVFVEGGHHACNVGICNLFATEPAIPVVVIGGGGFANLWKDNLIKEFGDKKALDKVIPVPVPDGTSVKADDVKKALTGAGIQEGTPFNILFVSSETSTSVMVPKQTMIDILNIPGRKRALVDASSGAMVHEIPGTTNRSLNNNEVIRGVSYFATGQKGFRLSSDLTLLIFCQEDLEVTSPDVQKNARIPMPKDIAIAPPELDGEILKRSTRVAALLEAHYALSYMAQKQQKGTDYIAQATQRSENVQQAVSASHVFDFFVPDPIDRGHYNIVINSILPVLESLSAVQSQSVIEEAHKILTDEELARNIKPYQGRGDFRFTTLDIKSQEQATLLLAAIAYAVEKAFLKMTHKTFTLIAEDQFLYRTEEEVNAAIAKKKAELANEGIEFIDARHGLPTGIPPKLMKEQIAHFYTGLPMGNYVIYMPQLASQDITQEFKNISAATLNPRALVVAAKTVPPEAQFDIFIRQGAGTNNIPKEQAQKDGHVVVNCPGVNAKVTSDNTLNALAEHPHTTNFANMAMKGAASALNLGPLYGKSPSVDKAMLNTKVKDKIIAVLGAGDIGTQTILTLLASDAKEVRVYSRGLAELGLDPASLRESFPKLTICDSVQTAMQGAHIAINHLPLDQTTKGIINTSCITNMADTGEIVDASRPGIIDPKALIDALDTKKLTRAFVDFDTPDKAPKDEYIKALFEYAQKNPQTLFYSPHAFADTCPDVRQSMMDQALLRVQEIRSGTLYNFAGLGTPPGHLTNQGSKKPEGIIHLKELLTEHAKKKPPTALSESKGTAPFEEQKCVVLNG